jgi:uncharacterized membrane protein (UPF0182 family)
MNDDIKEELGFFARYGTYFIIFMVVMTVVGLGMRWLSVSAEREIFEASYQKQAGDKLKEKTMNAQIVELRSLINSGTLTDKETAQYKAKIRALKILSKH